MSSLTPSMYLRSSQASRLLPMPPWPVTDRSRTRRSREVAWRKSLSRRSSSSRPTNGASMPSLRPWPPRSATTRRARHAGTGAGLPLRSCSPAGSKAIAARRGALGGLADEDGAGRRHRLEPGRGVHHVAGDHPLADRADRDGGLAGEDAGPQLERLVARLAPRWRTASTRSRAVRTARSASSSCATGVPQTAITASPMNFSTVPAVALDDLPAQLEVARQELADVLGVASRRSGR